MSGLGDKLMGSAKEAAGKVTGDDELEAKGKAQQISGNLQDRADEAKDAAGKKANELRDAAGEKVNDVLDSVKDKTNNDD